MQIKSIAKYQKYSASQFQNLQSLLKLAKLPGPNGIFAQGYSYASILT